jgi:hypothetical protein
MAAKVYSAPAEIKVPEFDSRAPFETYNKACDDFVDAVKAYCKKNGSSECRGEEIHFPVADGAARYVVFALRPVTLIHLPVGDAWQFQYANLLTAKAVREEVRRNKSLKAMFARAK